ncbi:MAG: TonB-dependent receptor [Alloprevotella sp.]
MPFLLPLLSVFVASAPADTASFDIEEAVVVASPKETRALRRQPLSVSLFDARSLELRGVNAAKDLSSLAPNLYMPDYGSRLTSAVYIRGIGSRINTPAVGMYVDNVPYSDKTGYDFHFADVDRVDVLRGPQGTLYGRGAMGGVIRIFTANPLHHSGTDVEAGFTTRTGGRRVAFTTYLHPRDKMGLSVGGFYEGAEGFFTNRTTGKKQDGENSAGGKLRWVWQPTDVVKIDWTTSYQYTDEGANPYSLIEDLNETNPAGEALPLGIHQNRPSTYRRHLLNSGLGVEHTFDDFVLTSTTAWQMIDDRLFMDQDFTAQDIFTLEQKQKMHNLSEEIALRSRDPLSRCKWTAGAFLLYQRLDTSCPVTFRSDGVNYLNRMFASVLPSSPSMTLALQDPSLPFVADLFTPSFNAAFFGQSTVSDFPFRNVDLTVGVRVDYDHRQLDLASGTAAAVPYHFSMSMGPQMSFAEDLQAEPTVNGKVKRSTWQVLPKASLSYRLPDALGNVYFTVSKGCRAGGFNIQAYSDLAQSALQKSMMEGVKAFSTEQIMALPMPEEAKQRILAMMNGELDKNIPADPQVAALYYKPEYTWSYEWGAHLSLLKNTLWLDLAAFYMKTRDQQLAQFAGSQFGRTVVNAGRSASCGGEVGIRASLLNDRLHLNANYGYTNARFRSYAVESAAHGSDSPSVISFRGKRVPFVPLHTMSLSADFRQPLASSSERKSFVKALAGGVDVKGDGDVKWDEMNTYGRSFRAILGVRLSVELAGNVTLSAWGRNLTGEHYSTFEFQNMNHRFAQSNEPRHFGFDVKWHF